MATGPFRFRIKASRTFGGFHPGQRVKFRLPYSDAWRDGRIQRFVWGQTLPEPFIEVLDLRTRSTVRTIEANIRTLEEMPMSYYDADDARDDFDEFDDEPKFKTDDTVEVTSRARSTLYGRRGTVRSCGVSTAMVYFPGVAGLSRVSVAHLTKVTALPNQLVQRLEREKESLREKRHADNKRLIEINVALRTARKLPNLASAPTGTLLQFQKQFASSSRVYSYAVLKADNGYWYATSNNTHSMTTDQLYDFLMRGVDVSQIMLVVGRTPLAEVREW